MWVNLNGYLDWMRSGATQPKERHSEATDYENSYKSLLNCVWMITSKNTHNSFSLWELKTEREVREVIYSAMITKVDVSHERFLALGHYSSIRDHRCKLLGYSAQPPPNLALYKLNKGAALRKTMPSFIKRTRIFPMHEYKDWRHKRRREKDKTQRRKNDCNRTQLHQISTTTTSAPSYFLAAIYKRYSIDSFSSADIYLYSASFETLVGK